MSDTGKTFEQKLADTLWYHHGDDAEEVKNSEMFDEIVAAHNENRDSGTGAPHIQPELCNWL